MKLKPFYVYELTDPISKKTFYVGKGQGRRGHEHLLEALLNENRKTDKLERIREIQEKGGKVKVRVIGRYKSEEEAFAVESTLIHWMYGFQNLTNIQPGHGSSTIREKGCYDDLEGIDIPERKLNEHTGDYSKIWIERRSRYRVEESMKRIKTFLENNSDLRFSEVDISNPRWTTISLTKNGVKLVVGRHNSPAEHFWIEVQSIDSKKDSRAKILELCSSSELESRDKGNYAKILGCGNKLMDPEKVLSDVNRYFSQL